MNGLPIHFVIVTPSYNLEDFIEQTILSVISQAGDFTIRYHIQDGGSTDGTPAVLQKWQRWLAEGTFPVFCCGIEFSHVIEKDEGMYHAINRGFAHARPGGDPCVMTWINADDLLAPGSLAAVASFLRHQPEAALISGRTAIMADVGFLSLLSDPQPRTRADIARGVYIGDKNGFIQQEGLFWRSCLWDQVGGLDDSLRLAGDFDLWKRMAEHAEYHCLNTLTGIHRKRKGQLSGNTAAYDKEVKQVRQRSGTPPELPQEYIGYHEYDIVIDSWKKAFSCRPNLANLSAVTLGEAVSFSRKTFRAAQNRRFPPWFLTSSGWRARRLKKILDATTRLLHEQIRRSS